MPEEKPKKPRGFATMTPEKRRRIASLGGLAAQATGRCHRFTREEAVIAGALGGKRAHALGTAHQFDTAEARAAGRKGGGKSKGRRRKKAAG